MKALYRTFLSTQATLGRLAGLAALGLLAVLLGVVVGAGDSADPVGEGIGLISSYGLALFVPVTTLVFASAVLGEPNEDGTLVYLWLRPVARWRLVAVAVAAALTVALPVAVVPLTVAAVATGAGAGLVVATLAATTMATVAYAGVFTWLGLRARRALLWGMAYILVWEGFVARAGGTASLLAVRAHTRSLLARLADGAPELVEVTLARSIIVPLAAAAGALTLTVRRLSRQDVA